MECSPLLEQLLDALPTPAYVCDAAGVLVHYNQRAVKLWGRTPRSGDTEERFCGSFGLELPDGNPGPEWETPVAVVLRTGEPAHRREMVIVRPDGSRVIVEAHIDPLRDDSGRVVGAVNVFVDVTAQRQADLHRLLQERVTEVLAAAASLEAAAPELLASLEPLPSWDFGTVWAVSADGMSLRCLAVHTRGEEAFPELEGVTRRTRFRAGEGLPGRVLRSARPQWIPNMGAEKDLPRLQVAARAGLHALFAFPFALGGEVLGLVELFYREVCQPSEDLLRLTATLGSQVGQFIERTRAEAHLQSTRERTHLITLAAEEVVYDWDLIADRGLWDGAMEGLFGYSPEEAGTEMSWWEERIHPEDRERVVARLRAWFGSDEPYWADTYRFRCRDDSYRLVEDRGHAVRDRRNRAVRVLGAMRDLSKQQLAEAERQRRLEREQVARAEAELLSRRLERLHHVTQATLGHLSMEELQQEMLRRIQEVIGVESVSLFALEGEELSLVSARGLEAPLVGNLRIPLGRSFAGKVAEDRTLITWPDAAPEQLASLVLRERGARALLGLPLEWRASFSASSRSPACSPAGLTRRTSACSG